MSDHLKQYLNLAYQLDNLKPGLALDATHKKMDHLWERLTIVEQYEANIQLKNKRNMEK